MQQRRKANGKKPAAATPTPEAQSASAFAEELAARVRTILGETRGISEKKMFGGIGFLLHGNLVAGASKRGLLLRTGKNGQHEALTWPNSRPMVMRGRTMEGYVYLDPAGTSNEAVRSCIDLARDFVATLPKK